MERNSASRGPVVALLAAGLVAGGVLGGIVGYSAQPEPEAKVVTRTVEVPGPTRVVEVPGPTVTVTAPPPAPEATKASGPKTSFGSGTYEVGVDIEAGKYKTDGTDGCYWARLSSPSSRGIIKNFFGEGPQTVTVKKGEYFESQRCGTWTKVG